MLNESNNSDLLKVNRLKTQIENNIKDYANIIVIFAFAKFDKLMQRKICK